MIDQHAHPMRDTLPRANAIDVIFLSQFRNSAGAVRERAFAMLPYDFMGTTPQFVVR